MVRLIAHGGVGEIGGNKVLVEGLGGTLALDFGLSFGDMGSYYSEFCQPRGHSYILDQLALGLLPDVAGIYRPDMLGRMGRSPDEPRYLDGLFLSHAHMDHMGNIPALRPDVPILLSAGSRAVMDTLDTVGQSFGMPDMFLAYTAKFEVVPAKRGGLKRGKGEDVRTPRDVRVIENGREVQVANDLSVTPLAVDHSLPGALGALVHVDGRSWAYTGDLRFHGTHAHRSRAFVDTLASEEVDVLVTEGTRVGEPRGNSEADVRQQVEEIIQSTSGLVLANYPARDLDRIVSFHEAARSAGRELVVDARQALLLENLGAALGDGIPRLGDGLRVLARRQGWGVVGDDQFEVAIQEGDYKTWERPLMFSAHRVLPEEVREAQDAFVVYVDFFHLQVLVDLRPRPGAVFVRSMVEPFNEEMELDEARVDNWMARFGLEKLQVHASGHASGEDLREMVRAIGPRVVVPIHTERPEAFRDIHDDVRPPVTGVPMEL